jgi:SAM-dependent methyltransferase
MLGGVASALERGSAELDRIGVDASSGDIAVDLGAGFGMHAIPLARRGFNVLAIDSCGELLDELNAHRGDLPITIVRADLQSFYQHLRGEPELVLCMGDTITHLADVESVRKLIRVVSDELGVGGRFVVTLRDYTTPLIGENRIIPVRSDDGRILTCFLEYGDSHVTVHDILHERDGTEWTQRVSTYKKLRLSPEWLLSVLQDNAFAVNQGLETSGVIRLMAHRV